MDQPPALHDAEDAAFESCAPDTLVWESDLADLAAVPVAAVDSLAPLHPMARVLEEVLRPRSSTVGGGEPPPPPGRAE